MGLQRAWGQALTYLFFILCPLPLFAQEGGPSGLIRYTYQKDDNKDIDAESTRNSFIQEYKLGYQGDVYSPRLFLYNVGGSFVRDDSSIYESRIGRTTDTAKGLDYNFKLDFIQGTKYPFTLYGEKFELPTWTIQPDRAYLTRQETDRYGLVGSARFGDATSLRYDFHEDETRTTGLLQQTDQRNKGLLVGIDSRQGEGYISASYSHQENLEKVSDTYNAISDARISFSAKPSPNARFSMDAGYSAYSNPQFEDTGARMNYAYAPSADFYSNLNVYVDRIQQQNLTSYFTTLNGNTFYKITPYVAAHQDLTLYRSSGDSGDESTESLTLGLALTRPLPDGITVIANAAVNGTWQQGMAAPSGTVQQPASVNRNSDYYSLDGGISKLISPVNTEIRGGAFYFAYASSRGGTTTRYGYRAALTSRFMPNLFFQSLLNSMNENAASDEISGITTVTKTSHLISDNSLEYVVQLSNRGSLIAKAGAIYESGTTPRTASYVSSAVRYAARGDLSLNADIAYYKESLNQTSTTTGSVGADYRLRSIILKLSEALWREDGPQGNRTRSSLMVQASRSF